MLVALVEDDFAVAAALRMQLEERGFRIETISNGATALARFERHDLDAAVLDMGLPDMDGLDVIAAARRGGMWAPILVATARDDVADRVRALEVGADDYIVKPFEPAEVAARLAALARRASAPRWAPLGCGNVALDADRRDVVVAGRHVELSPRQSALLELLLRRRGQVVTRDEILAEVFGYAFNPGTNLVDVHVAHLRAKLAPGDVTIRTVRGVGYCIDDATLE